MKPQHQGLFAQNWTDGLGPVGTHPISACQASAVWIVQSYGSGCIEVGHKKERPRITMFQCASIPLTIKADR